MNLLTTTELAAQLGVTSQCVRLWVADGKITPAATLSNGQHLFRPSTKRPKPARPGPKPARKPGKKPKGR